MYTCFLDRAQMNIIPWPFSSAVVEEGFNFGSMSIGSASVFSPENNPNGGGKMMSSQGSLYTCIYMYIAMLIMSGLLFPSFQSDYIHVHVRNRRNSLLEETDSQLFLVSPTHPSQGCRTGSHAAVFAESAGWSVYILPLTLVLAYACHTYISWSEVC